MAVKLRFDEINFVHSSEHFHVTHTNVVVVVVLIGECSEALQLSERIKRNAIGHAAVTWNR